MRWIKVVTRIASDDAIRAVAKDLHVEYPTAVGLCVLVFLALPANAKDGRLRDIPDPQLEGWAIWSGRRSAFARAFRKHLCDDAGVVRDWEEINGAAIRESERETERKASQRKSRSMSRRDNGRDNDRDITPNGAGTSAGSAADNSRDIAGDVKREKKIPSGDFSLSSRLPARARDGGPSTYVPPRASVFCASCEPVKDADGFWDHAPTCPQHEVVSA